MPNFFMRSTASIFLLAVISGCATVRTYSPDIDGVNVEGVTYFLPKRDVKFIGARTPLKKTDVVENIKKAKSVIEKADAEIAAAKIAKAQAELALKAQGLSSDRITQLNDDLIIANYQIETATRTKTLKQEEVVDLEKTLLQFDGQACLFSYDIKLEMLPIMPDSSARFVANLSHSVLRDDAQKFTVTSDGLLNSADITATDRSGDIIVELAGAIAGLGKAGGPASVLRANNVSSAAPPDCATAIKEFAFQFDPMNGHSLDGDATGINDRLANAGWPFKLSVLAGNISNASASSVSSSWNTPVRATRRDGAPYPKSVDGLLYRTALPVTIVVEQCNKPCAAEGAIPIPVQASLVSLPQAGPISYIPMRSSAFVQTVDNVVFANGMLTSWEANRPSEVLEFVRLPIKIARSIVSIPTELIQLRVNYTNEATTLQQGYAQQLEAQRALVEIQACIREVEKGLKGSVSECVS